MVGNIRLPYHTTNYENNTFKLTAIFFVKQALITILLIVFEIDSYSGLH